MFFPINHTYRSKRAAIKEKHINPQIANKTNIYARNINIKTIFLQVMNGLKPVVTYLRRLTVYDPGERTVSVWTLQYAPRLIQKKKLNSFQKMTRSGEYHCKKSPDFNTYFFSRRKDLGVMFCPVFMFIPPFVYQCNKT